MEDKDTQTEKNPHEVGMQISCCNRNGSHDSQNSSSNPTNSTCNCMLRDSTSTMQSSSTCLSPVPSTSKESEVMETENAQSEELEQNSLLVSQHNPLLSHSSSVLDDLSSFLDPPSISNVSHLEV